MSDYPAGTMPVVFESGVIWFDENGALHVCLTHSETEPHPLKTHPNGEDTFVPDDVRKEVIVGSNEGGGLRSRSGLREVETLPEGLELVFEAYESITVEASGDLTVVLQNVDSPPDWFTPGMVHRFDGPEEGISIWKDSAPPPKPQPKKTASPPPRPSSATRSSTPKPGAANKGSSGCLGVVLAVFVGGTGVVWMLEALG